jgi:hypothetical protein
MYDLGPFNFLQQKTELSFCQQIAFLIKSLNSKSNYNVNKVLYVLKHLFFSNTHNGNAY